MPTLPQRIVTTFIIVMVVLLILSLIGWMSGGWEELPLGSTVGLGFAQ